MTVYFLFEITLLILPVAAILLGRANFKAHSNVIRPAMVTAALLIAAHLVAYTQGYSLRGDYADYGVLSLEYFTFCLFISTIRKVSNNWYTRGVYRVGLSVMIFGFIAGGIGMIFFPVISQDYVTDKTFHWTSGKQAYETRRYSFGFATMIETKYTFDTYRTFGSLPIEKQIDRTIFMDLQTDLNIGHDNLKITRTSHNNTPHIQFQSENGKIFTKKIE